MVAALEIKFRLWSRLRSRCQQAATHHLPQGSWPLAAATQQSLDRTCRSIFGRCRVFHGKLLADGKLWVSGSFGQWKALSLLKFWHWHWCSQPTYLTKCFWYHHCHHYHHHHHHHHHHPHHHDHQPLTKCTHICAKSTGNWLQTLLRELSQRSALPTIHFSTFCEVSKAAIVNTMTFRHREIL